MKKIRVTQYGVVHYNAVCAVCDFSAGILTQEHRTREDVRNAVRKHVIKTGHEVSIESGEHTNYELIGEAKAT